MKLLSLRFQYVVLTVFDRSIAYVVIQFINYIRLQLALGIARLDTLSIFSIEIEFGIQN